MQLMYGQIDIMLNLIYAEIVRYNYHIGQLAFGGWERPNIEQIQQQNVLQEF